MASDPEAKRLYDIDYRTKNKAKKRQQSKDYRAKNKDKIKEKAADYREKNKEHIKEQNHLWYLDNKEHCHTRTAAWRAANPEKQKAIAERSNQNHAEQKQAWRQENLEHCLEYQREWQKTNPTKTAAYSRRYNEKNHEKRLADGRLYDQKRNGTPARKASASTAKHRRRAQRQNAAINDLTAAQWREIQEVYDHRCVYCGKRRKGHLTQDHLTPLSKGGNHTASNVVPACSSCNSRKHAGPVLSPVQPLLLTLAPVKKKKESA